MSEKLLSISDLSEYLGVPKGTLYQWRTKGYGPQGRRVGKYVRYRPEDVDAWIDGQGAA
ncbi:helix-turn-helix domain-containing protein [Amycolatopsis sp.]|uniref:helix-turn-helix transcriptional regulator n=1 Tax=Amycolatopsis sp. TaxID=37632 RepID=UPI002BAE6E83|nr:helix-turn-helix domain-containing protein [Amycolatopsis sp.]HVV09238.1 helix-turn-helix domain-containing protein [Amycolatopsis sp.]